MEEFVADHMSQELNGTRALCVAVPSEDEESNCNTEHLQMRKGESEQQRPYEEANQGSSGLAQLDHEATRIEKVACCDDGGGLEPPDGGWGWVVAFASAVIMFLINAMASSFGILFSKYLLQEGTSSTMTFWIYSVQTLFWNVSIMFLRALTEEFGWRAVGIVGSFLTCLGFSVSSFTPAPEFLFISFSLLCGIGAGTATGLSFVVVPNYFRQRRGAANAIVNCGDGLGQIFMPPFIVLLQDNFGDRGATLIISGIMLHACVAAATFHPLKSHMKVQITPEGHKDAALPRSPPTNTTPATSSKPNIFVRVAKSVVSNLRILRSKRACIISLSSSLIVVNNLNFLMMVPFAFQDEGLSIDDSALCMSAMAVASLIIRSSCSLFSDFNFFSVRACYLSGCAVMCISAGVFPLLRSREWLLVVMVVYGIGHGANMGTFTLMLIDVMGLKSLAPLLGTSCFCNGIGLFLIGPLIGIIRDASQSYAISIWVLSSLGMGGTLLWVLMGRAMAYDKQRHKEGRLDHLKSHQTSAKINQCQLISVRLRWRSLVLPLVLPCLLESQGTNTDHTTHWREGGGASTGSMAFSGAREKAGQGKGAAECQELHVQREEKCQDINANEKQWRDGDRDRDCSVDDDSAAGGDEKPPQNTGSRGNKQGVVFSQDERVQYKLVPPEGGWGWMVVLGTFIIVTLLPSMGPSFGVLFSDYLIDAGSSSTNTAWIFNLQCFLWFISGLLTRPLTQELGWRPVGMTGSVMASVGLMLSAITPFPKFLFFSYSVLTGIGGGLVTCQCFTILPHYFHRLRGITNAIMMSGICLGQFLVPPVSRYLQDIFGFRGATLIMGAIMLNASVGASFFHPYEWHQKRVIVEEEPEEYVPALPAKPKAMDSPHLGRGMWRRSVTLPTRRGTGCLCALRAGRRQPLPPGTPRDTTPLSASPPWTRVASPPCPLDDEEEKADAKAQKKTGEIFLIRVIKSTKKDLAVLKYLRACIFCFGGVLCINGFLNFLMMVPFAMLEVGLSKDASSWCLSVSAGCNLVTRIMVSTLSDFKWFNKRIAYLSGFLLISASITAFTFSTTSELLLTWMATYGVGVGACMGIYNIVIIDVMGEELLAPVFGTSSFCTAIGFICLGPLIGFIRDVTQSYAVSMRITAGMLLMSFLAWMFMNVAEKIDRRRKAAKEREEEEEKP
ncbi:uncharacterized protein LOC123513450 [Portunus trituberculatus]|nr:uncharacterized protein LOC123513450 [Portunus trituberculatus]